jgi:demethylmenaquinone methyltransferase/2-methoxy-6-polyprenyl-1,4-benzoquinol methylase
MTHASADMRAYYAERAPYYDAVYLKPERQADVAFLREHLPARLQARTVLEVACGTGYWTQHIAPVVRRMVATDLTAEPLALARLRPHTANVSNRSRVAKPAAAVRCHIRLPSAG